MTRVIIGIEWAGFMPPDELRSFMAIRGAELGRVADGGALEPRSEISRVGERNLGPAAVVRVPHS